VADVEALLLRLDAGHTGTVSLFQFMSWYEQQRAGPGPLWPPPSMGDVPPQSVQDGGCVDGSDGSGGGGSGGGSFVARVGGACEGTGSSNREVGDRISYSCDSYSSDSYSSDSYSDSGPDGAATDTDVETNSAAPVDDNGGGGGGRSRVGSGMSAVDKSATAPHVLTPVASAEAAAVVVSAEPMDSVVMSSSTSRAATLGAVIVAPSKTLGGQEDGDGGGGNAEEVDKDQSGEGSKAGRRQRQRQRRRQRRISTTTTTSSSRRRKGTMNEGYSIAGSNIGIGNLSNVFLEWLFAPLALKRMVRRMFVQCVANTIVQLENDNTQQIREQAEDAGEVEEGHISKQKKSRASASSARRRQTAPVEDKVVLAVVKSDPGAMALVLPPAHIQRSLLEM
jgi:hypothetical protein